MSLRDLRSQQEYTEQYVAYKLNISQPTYSRLENREIALSYERAQILGKLYGKSVSEIMEEYNDEKR